MRRGTALLALLSTLTPTHVSAHVGHVIVRAERYLKLDVSDRSVRVVVSLTLGPEEGARVLESADTNGDGRVTSGEADAYLAQWASALLEELPLTLDGRPVALIWGEGYLAPIGEVRPVSLTVEMVSRFALSGGEQTVLMEDRMVRREVFERTDVAFDVRDGAELVRSGLADALNEPVPDLAYGGDFRPGEPVVLSAVVRAPERAPAPEGWRWSWWLLGVLTITVLIRLGTRTPR